MYAGKSKAKGKGKRAKGGKHGPAAAAPADSLEPGAGIAEAEASTKVAPEAAPAPGAQEEVGAADAQPAGGAQQDAPAGGTTELAGPSSAEQPAAADTAQSALEAELAKYKASHRSVSKSWDVPASFPDSKVLEAYLHPRVDDSKEKFEFRAPDVPVLRQYCLRHFGWTSVRLPTCSMVCDTM